MFLNVSLTCLQTKFFTQNVPTFTNIRSLTLSKSRFLNSFGSFLISTNDATRFRISSSTFKNYLSPVISFDAYHMFSYKSVTYTKAQTFLDSEFISCQFEHCTERAIILMEYTGNITITKCSFTNCFIKNKRMNGGAINFIGGYLCVENSKFEGCKCGSFGSAIYASADTKCKIIYSNFNKCSDQMKNLDSTVYMNSTGGNVRSVNNSNSMSYGNAGFYVHIIKNAKFWFYNAYNVSGKSSLSISLNFPIKYGNIVACSADSGLVEPKNRDGFVTNYYFARNNGFLVAIVPNLLVVFTDCVFLDYTERPKAGNVALRGKFLLSNASCTPYSDPGKRVPLHQPESSSHRISGIFFLILSCGILGFLWWVSNPLGTDDDESENEKEIPLEQSKEETSSKESFKKEHETGSKENFVKQSKISGVYKRSEGKKQNK